VALGALMVSLPAALPAYADEEYLPLQVYRQGPYAAGGTGFFGGMIDYMNLINMRDGGVNGVKKYGFEVKDIEVPHPGAEQGAQWLEIRRYQPDFVILRGWGIMNPVALKTARKTGYLIDKIVGNIWSNSEEDVKPAGEAGVGYVAITTQLSGTESPVLQDIIKTVYGAGKGNLDDKSRIGSTYHNLGVLNGILTVEAMRKAQAKFGNRMITGDEFRWGFEHLKLDEADVEKLGAKGLMGPSINVTCEDHEGHGLLTFQKWDGKAYHPATDWFKPDWASLRPYIEKEAADYAKEKGITARDCQKAETDWTQ
jgi:branched-chain amino acid transport system substrate-binding protein